MKFVYVIIFIFVCFRALSNPDDEGKLSFYSIIDFENSNEYLNSSLYDLKYLNYEARQTQHLLLDNIRFDCLSQINSEQSFCEGETKLENALLETCLVYKV